MIFTWAVVFIVSLFVLIKASDFFTESAEKIGLAFKISPFILGVTVVSVGTSLPELSTSIIAVIKNQTELVAANAIGSNIANILLVVGILAIIAGTLTVKRSLIDLDLPLLVAATALIMVIMWDKTITLGEGIIAVLGYVVYAAYTIKGEKKEKVEAGGIIPGEDIPATREKRHHHIKKDKRLGLSLVAILLASMVAIYFGASWTVRSIQEIANIANVAPSIVAILTLAIGTSLPELFVSISAIKKRKFEIALGNVFGSNIFNALVVMGIPAFIKDLHIDNITFTIGLPFVVGATILYTFSGISKKIHNWEGMMYILIYILFIVKVVGLF